MSHSQTPYTASDTSATAVRTRAASCACSCIVSGTLPAPCGGRSAAMSAQRERRRRRIRRRRGDAGDLNTWSCVGVTSAAVSPNAAWIMRRRASRSRLAASELAGTEVAARHMMPELRRDTTSAGLLTTWRWRSVSVDHAASSAAKHLRRSSTLALSRANESGTRRGASSAPPDTVERMASRCSHRRAPASPARMRETRWETLTSDTTVPVEEETRERASWSHTRTLSVDVRPAATSALHSARRYSTPCPAMMG
mmetsp:Transcript_74780/g.112716  ORF Transcript_74780/g.112716 Transcript_74780/m.112716 type:complete len:254 (+) Transcript_74780:86-847(+)